MQLGLLWCNNRFFASENVDAPDIYQARLARARTIPRTLGNSRRPRESVHVLHSSGRYLERFKNIARVWLRGTRPDKVSEPVQAPLAFRRGEQTVEASQLLEESYHSVAEMRFASLCNIDAGNIDRILLMPTARFPHLLGTQQPARRFSSLRWAIHFARCLPARGN